MSSTFQNPTRRVIANGILAKIQDEIAPFHPKQILLTLGSQSFKRSTHYNQLKESLKSFEVHEFSPINSSPTTQQIEDAVAQLKSKKNFDLIIAIGGGSVLDFAKAIAILMTQKEGSPADYIEGSKSFLTEPIPLIVVPTTAGTGSEVTQYASVETKSKQKISLSHPWLFPKVALIDPSLTYSMPSYVTACTGFDAISQAIESFWSRNNSPLSETYALRAIPLLLKNIELVIHDPKNERARYEMALASSEAGIAISQTKTTAVHAVSYPLTTYHAIAHGHACALTLSSFIEYNEPVLKGEKAEKLKQAMQVPSFEKASLLIERLMDAVGLKRSLKDLGVAPDALQNLIDNSFRADRVKNNPRELTPEDLKKILKRIY